MLYEFYPLPGTKVPVKVNGKDRGNLLKLVFDMDSEYPLNHKLLTPDLINVPVEITVKDGMGFLVEPERLGRHQNEGFRLHSVRVTKEEWDREIYYRPRPMPEEDRREDSLDLADSI